MNRIHNNLKQVLEDYRHYNYSGMKADQLEKYDLRLVADVRRLEEAYMLALQHIQRTEDISYEFFLSEAKKLEVTT